MEINRNAPATAEGELRIDADPQTVFSVISADRPVAVLEAPDVKSVTPRAGSARHGVPVEGRAELPHLHPAGGRPDREIADRDHMGIKAVHCCGSGHDGGTLARLGVLGGVLAASRGLQPQDAGQGHPRRAWGSQTEAERRAATA